MTWIDELKKNQLQIGRQSTKVKRTPLPEKDERNCNEELFNKIKAVSSKMKSYVSIIHTKLLTLSDTKVVHKDNKEEDELFPFVSSFDGDDGEDYNIRYQGDGYYYGTRIQLQPKNRPLRTDRGIGVEMFVQFVPFEDEDVACQVLEWVETTLSGSAGEYQKTFDENNNNYFGIIDNFWESQYANDMYISIGPASDNGSGCFTAHFTFVDFVPAGMDRSLIISDSGKSSLNRILKDLSNKMKPMGNDLMELIK